MKARHPSMRFSIVSFSGVALRKAAPTTSVTSRFTSSTTARNRSSLSRKWW